MMHIDFFLVVLISKEIGQLFWQNEKSYYITQCMKICTSFCIKIKKYKRVHAFQFLSLFITIIIRIWKAFFISKFNSGLKRVKFFNIRNRILNFSSIDQISSSLKSTSSYLNTYLISWIYALFYLFFFLLFFL